MGKNMRNLKLYLLILFIQVIPLFSQLVEYPYNYGSKEVSLANEYLNNSFIRKAEESLINSVLLSSKRNIIKPQNYLLKGKTYRMGNFY